MAKSDLIVNYFIEGNSALLPHSIKVLGLNLLAEWGFSGWHLHVLPSFLPCACACFLLMSEDIQVGFTGYSKLV